ncbi:MAG: hypothetical protein C0599_07205 [Salinivirgaceae bacterium]|nr:MAG: hypothetical protein C0599_07205 [Salinivirgaceae bacterium]
MTYTFDQKQLISLFSQEQEIIQIPDSDFRIHNIDFVSNFKLEETQANYKNLNYYGKDLQIEQNWHFNYPVFAPKAKKNTRAIILLHGLNERSWDKYLTWGKYLAEKTGRTVILFPLAFHMNRGKEEWSDARKMSSLVQLRKSGLQETNQLSFVNVALSNRLTEDPMRFYHSGLQSAHDLLQLIDSIKTGNYPLLEQNTQINFMSYSIGAFLTQILFIANPNKLFSDSKAAIFCGGTTFNYMNGVSKKILDSYASQQLLNFYLYQFGQNLIPDKKKLLSMQLQVVAEAFKAMIPLPKFRKLKERRFARISKQMSVFGLKKDKVIPAKEILETLKNRKGKTKINFQLYDFPYQYTHEDPFPLYTNEKAALVDQGFENVFSKISQNLV